MALTAPSPIRGINIRFDNRALVQLNIAQWNDVCNICKISFAIDLLCILKYPFPGRLSIDRLVPSLDTSPKP